MLQTERRHAKTFHYSTFGRSPMKIPRTFPQSVFFTLNPAHFPCAANRLMASSLAHAVALVSGLAFSPKNKITAAPPIPRYHGASQSSHFLLCPLGGGVSLNRRPFTCPSPWTPSAKYPPGGPSAIPRRCALCGPRTQRAAFRAAVRRMPLMVRSKRRRACARLGLARLRVANAIKISGSQSGSSVDENF